VHFDIYEGHTPKNALFIKLDKVLKFTLKITSTCSKGQADVICIYGSHVIRRLNDGYLHNHFLNRCTVHFDIYEGHKLTNALFIKLDKVLKFTLKIASTCSLEQATKSMCTYTYVV